MRRLLPAAGLACLLCVSCLPVAFNLELSKAAALTAKMTQDNPSLINAGDDNGGSRTGWAYYPAVSSAGGFDYSSGFATSYDGMSVRVEAFSGGNQQGSWDQPIPNPDPHAPSYLAWPVKSGAPCLFGVVFDALSPAQSGYALFQATSMTGGPLSGISTGTPIGASVSANPGAFDDLHFLNGPTPTQARCSLQGATLPLTASGLGSTPSTLFSLIASVNRVQFFYDENTAGEPGRVPNRSFASWYDSPSGSWVCYAWDPTLPTATQLPIAHRIDALLSTGQLLSTEDEVGRLYDRDGNLLVTFDLGNLVYIAEEYVGGQARCYFSQALIYGGNVHFNIYWIPASQLASLGG